MKFERILSAALCVALSLSVVAYAQETGEPELPAPEESAIVESEASLPAEIAEDPEALPEEPTEPADPAGEELPAEPPEESEPETPEEPVSPGPHLSVNGKPIEMPVAADLENGTMYVAARYVTAALYPDSKACRDGKTTTIKDAAFSMTLTTGKKYLECNGRYLFIPEGIYTKEGELMVPLKTLSVALGTGAAWDSETGTAMITSQSGPLLSGDKFYDETTLYWLSHIIYAESGNQSIEGKIAVGNVVLNRVASPSFPNTIKEVLYQKNQFSPVKSGSIKKTPNESSVIAAKLALDGANTAGKSLFFVSTSVRDCWASRNRTYYKTIDSHKFYL